MTMYLTQAAATVYCAVVRPDAGDGIKSIAKNTTKDMGFLQTTMATESTSNILGINGTVVKWWINVTSNDQTGDSTYYLRIGGTNYGTITVGAGSTGYKEATLSQAITESDTFQVRGTIHNSGTVQETHGWGLIAIVTGA